MKKLLLVLLMLVSLPAFAADKQSTFDRVIANGAIKCGYAIWYPQMNKDPNTGALSGYDYEIMNAIGRVLGLKVEWVEETGWGTAQEGVAAGRFDMACNGFWGPPARTRAVMLSRPFIHQPLFVVVGKHVDTTGKMGFDWLNDPKYKVANLAGGMQDLVIQQHFSKAAIVNAAELSADGNIMADLAAGKADFTITNETPVKRYLEQNADSVKLLAPQVAVAANTMLLPGDDQRFKHMIDVTIAYLVDSGEVNSIMKKYLGDDKRAWLASSPSYEDPK